MLCSRPSLFALVLATILVGLGACAPKTGVAFTQLRYPRSTQTVKVGTADIAYVELGAGERTLVLIHGLGSYLPVWERNLDALARHHRVIAIDLPGYGKSTKADYAYTMAMFAKVVRGVIRQLGVERPVLVGHSMGGQIAMTYALTWPDDVEALVLTSPAGLEPFEDGEAKWLASQITPEFTCAANQESIYVRHAQNFHRMPKEAQFMVDDRVAVIGGSDFRDYCVAVSRSVAAMLDAPVYERLGEIRAPTLVLFGQQDALIPNPFLHGGSTERLAKKAVARFAAAELVMLDAAGHLAQFEQPAAWNDAVLGFVARTDGRAPTAAPRVEPGAPTQSLYEPGTDPDEIDAPPATPDPFETEPTRERSPTADPDATEDEP